MRVMAIVKATAESEAGSMPSERLLTEMGKFNEELIRRGSAPESARRAGSAVA